MVENCLLCGCPVHGPLSNKRIQVLRVELWMHALLIIGGKLCLAR